MGLFQKKDEEKKQLPELPGMSSLPELPPLPALTKSDISPLPSFSRNEFSASSGMGLQAIKATIREGSTKGLEYMPEERRTIEVSDKDSIKAAMAPRTVSKEPVFVKLDKFREATEKFNEIKEKVSEIEDSLRKLKEIKEKEDSELKSWDEEMQLIKQKVESIDNSLFNKI